MQPLFTCQIGLITSADLAYGADKSLAAAQTAGDPAEALM